MMRPDDFIDAGDSWLDDSPNPAVKKPAQKAENSEPVEYAVLWIPVYCPNCGSRNCPPYNSGDKVTRYHKCSECNYNFKSIEVIPEHVKKIRLRYEKKGFQRPV